MPFLLPSHPCSVPQCPTAAVPDPPWAGCSPLGSRGRPRGCSYHGADAVGGGGADGVVVGVCSCVHSAIARSKQRWVLVPTAGLLSPLRALPPSHTWEPPGTSLLPLSRGPCWQDTLPMPDPVLPTALRAGGVTVGSAGRHRELEVSQWEVQGRHGELGVSQWEVQGWHRAPPGVMPTAYLSLYAAAAAAGWAYL